MKKDADPVLSVTVVHPMILMMTNMDIGQTGHTQDTQIEGKRNC